MRDLHLTSPLMRGVDVQHLQFALDARLAARAQSTYRVAPDGVYGPDTAHAVNIVAYDLGLHHYEGTHAVTRLIENPKLRNPAELLMAHERQKTRNEHAVAVGGAGLSKVPVIAARYIGIAESPPGSNEGSPYPSDWELHFGMNGVSWCGCFAGSMVILAGGQVNSRVAYCPYIRSDAQSRTSGFDAWTTDPTQAAPGWLVLYCWDGSGLPEHVGVVESIHSDHVVAIEGNTGGSHPSDGGMVARCERPYNFVVGFARPRF